MNLQAKKKTILHYQKLFYKFGDKPEGVQGSKEGQQFRFEKLSHIGNLKSKKILDLGCGLGHLYPFLIKKFGIIKYTGIDIVPETIKYASNKYPKARFLCQDILEEDLKKFFDYILICGVFNNAMSGSTRFLKTIISKCFKHTQVGLGFNFISNRVNYKDKNMAYHNPEEIFKFCLSELSPKVMFHHWYQRCDVSVFVYK